MLGLLTAAVGVAQAVDGHQKAKKAGRQADAANARADGLLSDQFDEDREFFRGNLESDQNRLASGGFAENEARLQEMIRDGVDVDQAADGAADRFNTQFDASTDASRRQLARSGVNPNSSASAAFEEDVSFNRAIGAAGNANRARTEADDVNFTRSLAFLDRGDNLRNSLLNQQSNLSALAQDRAGAISGVADRHQENANAQGKLFSSGLGAVGTGLGIATGSGGALAKGGALRGLLTRDKNDGVSGTAVPGTNNGARGALQSNLNGGNDALQQRRLLEAQQRRGV